MNKINFSKLKNFLIEKKKISISVGIVLCVILLVIIFNSSNSQNLNIDSVISTNLFRSVRATGQVTSNTNLDLSFNKVGIIKSIKVNVGDVVKKDQVLATLDQGQVSASLIEAQGKLLSAKAKYQKILEGSSDEELALANVVLKNALTDQINTEKNQNNLVLNAYRALLNSNITAFSSSVSDTQNPPTITGTYILDKEGDIKISVNQGGGGGNYFVASGLIDASGVVSSTTPQPIGDTGLFIQFPNNYSTQNYWTISLPNKKAINYLTNYNLYKNALENKNSILASAQSLVDQRQAELALKKATARNADIDIAKAEVLSAEGSLQAVESAYEDTIIRAPANGTITKVDIKYGELTEIGKSVITLEDIKNLYIEALINEANIAYLKIGQNVDITFDAFGKDKKFTGVIIHIDPSAETSDGVVNYKIKISLDTKDDTIRPGMNANINVLAGEKDNVLAIPNIAILKKDGKYFVNVIVDDQNKKYKEQEVQTGFVGDNNLVEIISGLKQGDKIVLVQS